MNMKDILFTVKQQKREIMCVVASLFLAIVVNVFAILFYGTEWKELYTQWFAMLLVAVAFYFLSVLFRLIFWIILCMKKR